MGKKKEVAKGGAPEVLNSANTLQVQTDVAQTLGRKMAKAGLSSIASNADTARTFAESLTGEFALADSIAVLREHVKQVQRGDLSDIEARLTAQALALDAIFNRLAKRSAANMGNNLGACETYLKLALKAQAQCRATLETLVEVKRPRHVAFVKQANISNGPQQVNNGESFRNNNARAEENQSQQSKLLEDREHGCTNLDAGATAAAGRSHTPVEALDKIDWAQKHRR